MHCLSINATEKRGAALMRKARTPPTTLYRRLRKTPISATNHASGPVAPCSSPLSGGALVGRFGCGMPLNMAVLCPENRHGSPTTLPPGLQSLLTTTQSETVYSHDHYQRSQHNLSLEVQNEDRDHQRGAGDPEQRTARRDGSMRRLWQEEVPDGRVELLNWKQPT